MRRKAKEKGKDRGGKEVTRISSGLCLTRENRSRVSRWPIVFRKGSFWHHGRPPLSTRNDRSIQNYAFIATILVDKDRENKEECKMCNCFKEYYSYIYVYIYIYCFKNFLLISQFLNRTGSLSGQPIALPRPPLYNLPWKKRLFNLIEFTPYECNARSN